MYKLKIINNFSVHRSLNRPYVQLVLGAKKIGKRYRLRRTAVRETVVSRYHRGPVGNTPETPQTSRPYGSKGFKGGPQLGPHYAGKRQSLVQSGEEEIEPAIEKKNEKKTCNSYTYNGPFTLSLSNACFMTVTGTF